MSTQQLSNGNTVITAEVACSRTDLETWKDATLTFVVAIPPPGRAESHRDLDLSVEVEGSARVLSFSVSPDGDVLEAARAMAYLAGEQLACDVEDDDDDEPELEDDEPEPVDQSGWPACAQCQAQGIPACVSCDQKRPPVSTEAVAVQAQEPAAPDDDAGDYDADALADQFSQLNPDEFEALRVRLVGHYTEKIMARIMAMDEWSEEVAGLLFPPRIWDELPSHEVGCVPDGFEAFGVFATLAGTMQARYPDAWAAAKELRAAKEPV